MKSTVEFDLSNETHRAAIRAMLDTLDGTAPQQVKGSAETVGVVTPEPPKRKKATKPEAVQAETPVQPVDETPVQPVDETPEPVATETPVQPVAPETTAASTISIEDVRKAVSSITIASPEKRPELVKLLGEYGAANVTNLDPAHYGAFVERLKSI